MPEAVQQSLLDLGKSRYFYGFTRASKNRKIFQLGISGLPCSFHFCGGHDVAASMMIRDPEVLRKKQFTCSKALIRVHHDYFDNSSYSSLFLRFANS